MRVELTASFLFAAAGSSIEIYGTRGTLLISVVDLASRDINRTAFMRSHVVSGGEKHWHVNDLTPRFKLGQFDHQNAIAFAGCLVDGRVPSASVEDGRKALLLIQRAYEAARTGCRQQIHP